MASVWASLKINPADAELKAKAVPMLVEGWPVSGSRMVLLS